MKRPLVVFTATLFAVITGSGWAMPAIFKTYEVPTTYSLPARISIDTKGHIWFIESDSNKIGKFQFSREHFTEFDIPTTGSFPSDIIIGRDKKVWFTEQNANQLGVFDPVSGAFKEYDIP
ncbi:MAG: hypothetical protein GY938_07235, partial [Ketobacter sp.]|nr:hypothetical protein [Ketobacter sp.]